MPLKMKDLPETERPYEKLKLYGAEKLSNAELLAIIIKCGTKEENSISIANRVLLLTQNLKDINNVSSTDLMQIKGIGEIKAIQLKAMCELTSRMNKNNLTTNIKIKSPKDAYELLNDEMKIKKQEIMKALILNTKNIVIKVKDIVTGDSKSANVTIKQILAENIRLQAPKIIIAHNHPSGDPTPSKHDYLITYNVIDACNLLGIELLDHIVIGNNAYVSIMSKINNGEISIWKERAKWNY